MKKGILYIVSGPSGAGKSTLIKKALKTVDGFTFSVSYTTRERRPGEIDGVDYFFVDEDKFMELKEKDEFLEYAKVHGYYYGTSKTFIHEKLEQGYNIVLDVDVQGSLNIKTSIQEENPVLIFVLPPSYTELEKRLVGRGTESERDLAKRLEDSRWEVSKINEFNYVIVNRDVNESVNQLISVIIAEQLRVCRIENGLENRVDTFFKKEFER
ncbi:MAG: guanylate kinase [Oceanotoga sp.]|uniref:guanylate kinase n=1 Tax=Oceanotoga sp. TaxID=2108366 RepID=UPI0026550AC9|nr:guanylate kinase [Oceanotoga sp.]MDN5343193.1 guanylate kinase [Oceanotoga sp.]